MNRPTLRKVALGAVIALFLVSALVAIPFVGTHIGNASGHRWTVRGHLVPAVHSLTSHAIADMSQAIEISIALSLRNRSSLTALIAAQNDPKSPSYHRYLTPREFATHFAPTPATVNRVTAWLRSQGLVVHAVSSNRTLISASGSMAAVEKAFATTLSDYQVNGRTVYAPTVEPSVPDTFAGMIVGIAGLNNVGSRTHAPIINNAGRATRPHVGSGPGGGYTPSELRTAYNMNSLINSANGVGQTVAIFELDGYNASDVNAYLSHYGLGAAKYSNVLVDGATNTAGPGAIEVELDMEVVSAIAPGASQKIYIGPNTDQGVNDTYNKIVTDNLAKVTSTSWGLCEVYSGTSELQTLDNIFAQGAAQGQAFFAASGDAGAYDCGDTNLGVDSPADDPHVVGVGGTHLVTGSGGSYSSESIWSNPGNTSRGPMGLGSGGGLSGYFSQPSYQTGPGVNNPYSNGMRQTPDVSADADPNTGYSVYCTASASGCPGSGWIQVGGTSAAAPLWAGIAADLNQYLTANGKPTLGSASAALYSLFNTAQTYAPYHDVTSGNNLYYPATAGYDLGSGIGSPNVWNMARDLVNGPTGNNFSISAGPSSIAIAQGGGGSTTINTAVTSGSAGTINLTVSVTPAGPTASLSPTSITAGGASTLTVNVGAAVATGTYNVKVTGIEGTVSNFVVVPVNVTAGNGGGAITNGGFEAGDLSGWTSNGITAISATAHGGSNAARVGSTSPYRGDSSLSQTFTVPGGYGSVSFWYRMNCLDTVSFDWTTATLKDNTSSTTSTILGRSCTNNGLWNQISAPVTVGHSYTLTIIVHDDNYPTDPNYTILDDVTLSATVANPFVNDGFEYSSYLGWTTSGSMAVSSVHPHSGGESAVVGDFARYPGDSWIRQTVTAPAGATVLTFWYNVACFDSVAYDWATATLKDNTTGITTTILPHTCTNNDTWVMASARVISGHSYTLTLVTHDDNWAGDPTYTFYDDVSIS